MIQVEVKQSQPPQLKKILHFFYCLVTYPNLVMYFVAGFLRLLVKLDALYLAIKSATSKIELKIWFVLPQRQNVISFSTTIKRQMELALSTKIKIFRIWTKTSLYKTVQNKRLNNCVSELLRYELLEFVA